MKDYILKPGTRVKHKRFGEGVVPEYDPKEHGMIPVMFDNEQERLHDFRGESDIAKLTENRGWFCDLDELEILKTKNPYRTPEGYKIFTAFTAEEARQYIGKKVYFLDHPCRSKKGTYRRLVNVYAEEEIPFKDNWNIFWLYIAVDESKYATETINFRGKDIEITGEVASKIEEILR